MHTCAHTTHMCHIYNIHVYTYTTHMHSTHIYNKSTYVYTAHTGIHVLCTYAIHKLTYIPGIRTYTAYVCTDSTHNTYMHVEHMCRHNTHVCICACIYVGIGMLWCAYGGQQTTFRRWFSPSTMWVPGIELIFTLSGKSSPFALWVISQTQNAQFHIHIYKFSNV